MIPKTIHFIYGLREDFGKFSFSLCHYLAVLSAKTINKDYEIVVHYYHEPQSNEWWEKTKSIAKMVKLEDPPTIISGKKITEYAHANDLLRIEILIAEGGIYLDIDTICIRPFDPFLSNPKGCVMGLEAGGGYIGLCNAVIIARKNPLFLRLWRSEFAHFDPNDWNKMACRVPLTLAVQHPQLIHVEGNEAFFRLNWSPQEVDVLFASVVDLSRSYSQHLWEHTSYELYLSKLTLEDIMTRDTTYNLLARKVINEAHSQSIL